MQGLKVKSWKMNNNQKKTFSYQQWCLYGPSIHVTGCCAEWYWGWDWQIDEWFWYGIHSSWRDRTYWLSRQNECFDIRSKWSCFDQGATHTKELETNKNRKISQKKLRRSLSSNSFNFSWVFKYFFNKPGYNFDDVSKNVFLK